MDAVGLGTDLTDLDHSAHLLTAALNTIYIQYVIYIYIYIYKIAK